MFLTLAVFGILLGSCSQKQTTEPAIPVDAEIEKKVEETLSRMTLEEKIGQMTEITLDATDESFDANLERVIKLFSDIEPDCEVLV